MPYDEMKFLEKLFLLIFHALIAVPFVKDLCKPCSTFMRIANL